MSAPSTPATRSRFIKLSQVQSQPQQQIKNIVRNEFNEMEQESKPKKEKAPKEMKMSTYLNKFELLMKAHYSAKGRELCNDDIFMSCARSYAKYNGIFENFMNDPDETGKFAIYSI